MVLHVIIKNFGRVKEADIALNDLVVFVGNNNSGKTMIMQLIYGIRKELEHFPVSVSTAKKSDLNGQYLIRCDRNWFEETESQINTYLDENKTRILAGIFGISVSAGQIKIALEYDSSEFFVTSISEYQIRDSKEQTTNIFLETRQHKNDKDLKPLCRQISDWNNSDDAAQEAVKDVWKIILSGKNTLNSGQLFLPASRSGLQLLYRQFFVQESGSSLSAPIKDFLRFLQTYSQDNLLDGARTALLEFGERHLLQGKIIQNGDETFYVEAQGENAFPLYIASSMIHELTPFIKALNAARRIDWLYCDEVENSLHPLLQREMARWLIRMTNAGMHVIISSHSDTMASRFNNLFMLSRMDKKNADYKMLSELELMDADLLHPDIKAAVYEFRTEKNRKTIVEKLEFIDYPLMGYDFQLFSKNLDKLYDEAERITRQ